ncbi:MAG TPA: GNAT family N-acetyltransferase [Acidimicrobiales bacterium]
METRLVKVKGISAADERAWRALAARAMEPNPYFEPDFLMLCAKHFQGYADTTLVVAEEQGSFVGVLPIVRFDRPNLPPRHVASMIGAPTAVRSLGTPLIDGDCGDAAMGALLDALAGAAEKSGWPGIVSVDRMGNDGPLIESLHRMCEKRGFPVFTKEAWDRGVVRRGGKWERPLRKTRERQIAQKRRAMMRDSGKEVTLVDRTLDPSVVDDFLVMEMTGWKGREGGLAFAKDEHKVAWLHEWHQRWAPTGRLTVLSLQLEEIPVAIEFFVRAGDGIFCFRGAYDDSYSKYGPGLMVFADCMAYLLEHTDAGWMDSATDKDNAFLLEILPERRNLSVLYIGVGGILDKTVVRALPGMVRLGATQRQLRERWARSRPTNSTSTGT